MFAQSPGGTGSNKFAAISAMQGRQGEKRERDMMATGTGDKGENNAKKITQQAQSKQQDTIALWSAGEMGRSQPVKSHAGRVIDLQGDTMGTDIDLEDMAPTGSREETGRAWWAPAPPQFTPDSLVWSEDEEDWLPAKGEVRGKGKGVGRTQGVRPIRSYSKKDREYTGKRDSVKGGTPAHTAIAESASGERPGESRGERWRPGSRRG